MLNEMESRNLSKEQRDDLNRTLLKKSDRSKMVTVEGPAEVELPEGDKFEMTVGDVNSDEMGTAARANGNKAAYDLMPLEQVAFLLHNEDKLWAMSSTINHVNLFDQLGMFQRDACSAEDVLMACVAYHLSCLPGDEHDDRDLLGALESVMNVWDYGRKKYAEWNWAKGAPWSVPLACLSRHIRRQLRDPDGVDKDSKECHTAHIVCNAQMLVHYAKYWNHRGSDFDGKIADDRPYQYFKNPYPPAPKPKQ